MCKSIIQPVSSCTCVNSCLSKVTKQSGRGLELKACIKGKASGFLSFNDLEEAKRRRKKRQEDEE
jgi:hypothetical protein